MTSEEIVQRLLDEKKITVTEALIILKDLAKIATQQIFTSKTKPLPEYPNRTEVVCMYGVQISSTTYESTSKS